MSSKQFLLWFVHEFHAFRKPEIEALLRLFKIEPIWIEPITDKPYSVISNCTEAQVKQLMSRTVLVKWAFELWASSTTKHGLFEQLKSSEFINDVDNRTKSFKMLIETFNRTTSMEDKIDKIEELAFLSFEGKIDLKNPENIFGQLEYYPKLDHPEKGRPVDDSPQQLFFGKQVAIGQRHLMHKFNLKERKFISNTTMEPTLSLLIANIAGIKNGDLVLDPFVGSGGLLVAAAHFGGYVMGTDIDYKLLYGLSRPSRCNVKEREADESIYANLVQYGLESRYVDIIAGDSSILTFRDNMRFDAIICDPPYGIRESSIQVGSKKANCDVAEHMVEKHIPSKVHYNLSDIINDLLYFCCKYLAIGGRICFWVPVIKGKELPNLEHPCFEFVSSSLQELTMLVSRTLICLEKCKELDNSLAKDICKIELGDSRKFKEDFYGSIKERTELKRNPKQNKLDTVD